MSKSKTPVDLAVLEEVLSDPATTRMRVRAAAAMTDDNARPACALEVFLAERTPRSHWITPMREVLGLVLTMMDAACAPGTVASARPALLSAGLKRCTFDPQRFVRNRPMRSYTAHCAVQMLRDALAASPEGRVDPGLLGRTAAVLAWAIAVDEKRTD